MLTKNRDFNEIIVSVLERKLEPGSTVKWTELHDLCSCHHAIHIENSYDVLVFYAPNVSAY